MEELIKRLKNNIDFVEFTNHILNIIDEIDTVNGLDNMTNDLAGEEAKVRIKTKSKLVEIFKPFIDFREKRQPTEGELKKASGKFGL